MRYLSCFTVRSNGKFQKLACDRQVVATLIDVLLSIQRPDCLPTPLPPLFVVCLFKVLCGVFLLPYALKVVSCLDRLCALLAAMLYARSTG